jgi:predicted transposase/invertase (TIGR01784 family)
METYEKDITEYSGIRMAMEYSQELGYERGIEKGLMFRTFEIAKEMLKLGFHSADIAKATGLTSEQIQQL